MLNGLRYCCGIRGVAGNHPVIEWKRGEVRYATLDYHILIWNLCNQPRNQNIPDAMLHMENIRD